MSAAPLQEHASVVLQSPGLNAPPFRDGCQRPLFAMLIEVTEVVFGPAEGSRGWHSRLFISVSGFDVQKSFGATVVNLV